MRVYLKHLLLLLREVDDALPYFLALFVIVLDFLCSLRRYLLVVSKCDACRREIDMRKRVIYVRLKAQGKRILVYPRISTSAPVFLVWHVRRSPLACIMRPAKFGMQMDGFTS
jgi:hypothetical protein